MALLCWAKAILCRTGRVTDLRIVESLPYGMTEKSLEAVRQIQFTPAEMRTGTPFQKMRFEFHFNDRGIKTDRREGLRGTQSRRG